jgi:catechol 2,3-dioxygenase
MGLLIPNADMPFNITRMSHVVLTSRDLDATRFFYESGLGLEVTFQDSERLALRAIEEPGMFSLMFERMPTDGPGVCRAVGYRMYTDEI